MATKLKINEIKAVFTDIVRGYTVVASEKYGKFYIKHLNSFDSADIDTERSLYEKKAREMGVQTVEEYSKILEEQEIWTEKDETKIEQLKIQIRNQYKTKSKLFLKSQIDQIKKQTEKLEENLIDLEMEKKSLFTSTVEGFADKKINEQYIRLSTYKDEFLEEKKFSNEEFDEFDDKELTYLVTLYNSGTFRFHGNNMQLVALNPIFLNFFYLCDDNAVNFYGKPIVELSFYQAELFGHGVRFKNILSDTKSRPPDNIAEDPEKLIEWADANKNAESHLNRAEESEGGAATSLVGATKEDLEHLGIDTKTEGISLQKAAEESGGSLNMQDLMKLHGV
jgi:hypothetical protein